MHRALLVAAYACQVCLGLAVIALAAIRPFAFDGQGDGLEGESPARERVAGSETARVEARLPTDGPSLP